MTRMSDDGSLDSNPSNVPEYDSAREKEENLDSTKMRVTEWVESSGHALEMRLTRTLLQSGADSATMGRKYQSKDAESGRAREIDSVGRFDILGSRVTGSLNLVVEAKESPKQSWIAMYQDDANDNDHEALDAPEEHFVGSRRGTPSQAASGRGSTENRLSRLWQGMAPFETTQPASSIADGPGPIDDNRAKNNQKQTSVTAIHAAFSGAAGLQQEFRKRQEFSGFTSSPTEFGIFIPVAVTPARLFQARLGTSDVVVTDVNRLGVRVTIPGAGTRTVFVVRENAFEEFVNDIRRCVDIANESVRSGRL